MNSTPKAFLQIKSQYSNFNPTEKKIADYILNNPQELIYSTISQIGDKLKLADSTIFRFCKKIDFKGFHDLKISLATDVVKETKNYGTTQILDNDDEAIIINKVFEATISVLNDSLQSIDPKLIEQAVNILLNANQIVCYGNGGSGVAAMDAHHKLLPIGMNVSSYTDYHMQLMSAAQLTENDAVIAISHSGSNINIMNALDVAKKNGTKTIGITSFSKSPISKKVDVPLNVVSHETEYQFEAFASMVAHLTIINVLYINLILKRKELSNIALQKMRNAISYTKI